MRHKQSFAFMKRLSILIFILCLFVACDASNTSTENVRTPAPMTQESIIPSVPPSVVTVPDETGSELTVTFIDVGQGDSTLICCDGYAMLIDAGGESEGSPAVSDALRQHSITSLDYVILTHPDADHIMQADEVVASVDCKMLLLPECQNNSTHFTNLMDAIGDKGYAITTPVVGTTYSLGSASFILLAPNSTTYNSNNDYSIALLLTHGDNTFLFTGDAQERSEDEMLQNEYSLDADVYHVGHHGGNTSSTVDFLNAVTLIYAVISCGEDNTYGHPRAEVLNNLRSMGVQVFRTDEQGSIVATSDGTAITWNCSPSTTWQAGEPQDSAASSSSPSLSSSGTVMAYVLNTNTMKFHYPDCSSVPTIHIENRQDITCTREELIQQGFESCGNCHP